MATKTFSVRTVLRDSEGNTWIGTLGQGLVRLRAGSDDLQKMEKFSERDGLSTEFVWSLLEDREHNAWVGTQNGLNRFRDKSRSRARGKGKLALPSDAHGNSTARRDVVMDFTNPLIKGMSLIHCHLPNHEDKGMMAKILFE